MSGMDNSQPQPQRLSAMYQYHNAPEVAPAYGLEYDDTVYPSSDKYPVVHSTSYVPGNGHYTRKHAIDDNNRPPRIIFGMKVRTFLGVAAIFVLIIVGAAVGGAVGGRSVRQNMNNDGLGSGMGGTSSASSAAATTPTKASSSSTTPSPLPAVTPTFAPLATCQNNTGYSSSYASGSSGTVPPTAGLTFTRYCDFSAALTHRLAEAFVYSFDDCIELCAGYNFLAAAANCTLAVYTLAELRPGNCWVGSAGSGSVSSEGLLSATLGSDTGVLAQGS